MRDYQIGSALYSRLDARAVRSIERDISSHREIAERHGFEYQKRVEPFANPFLKPLGYELMVEEVRGPEDGYAQLRMAICQSNIDRLFQLEGSSSAG